MPKQKESKQIWIFLVKSFPTVVSKVSQPFWFVGKLIFRWLVLDVKSSCISIFSHFYSNCLHSFAIQHLFILLPLQADPG